MRGKRWRPSATRISPPRTAAVAEPGRQLLPVENRPPIAGQEAGERPEQRALSGAVRPDDGGDAVGGQLEIEPVEDANAAVPGAESRDRESRAHGQSSAAPACSPR